MSLKRAVLHSISVANAALGGAKATRSARTRNGREFAVFCIEHVAPLSDLRHTTSEQLRSWLTNLKESGLTTATINNKVASVRALVRARGVDLEDAGLADSKALGLEKRSRQGTKVPVTDEIFDGAVAAALAIGEEGLAHALKIERLLGVRGLEAMMSTHALEQFAKEAMSILADQPESVHIAYSGDRDR